MEKKDSIFAGLNPVPVSAPAPAPRPAPEPAAPAASPTDIAAEVLKAVDARLGERLALLEGMLKNAVEKLDAAPAAARGVEGRVAELSAACGSNDLKLAALVSLVKSENSRTLAAISAMRDEIKKTLRAGIMAAAADAGVENARQLEKIKETYGLSASSLAALSAVQGNISAPEESLSGALAGLKAFVKGWLR